MSIPIPGRPEDSEYAPYGKIYVERVEDSDLLRALTSQINDTEAVLTPLEDTFAASYRYEPDKWTIKQIVGHMIDTERIFAYRILRVSRGDQTPLPAFEQNDYVTAEDFNSRSVSDLLDELKAVRQSTIRLVRRLNHDAWLRRGTVSGYSVTARGIAFMMAGHELHHKRIIREKYLKQSAALAR